MIKCLDVTFKITNNAESLDHKRGSQKVGTRGNHIEII